MSQPLFGLVPAGQPVIVTPTESPTPTTFLFAIPPAAPAPAPAPSQAPIPTQQAQPQPQQKPFSHITVFLLPGVVLPPGTAAAIYLVTPPSAPGQTQPNSRFLGGVGPGKESAIFKLGTPSPSAAAAAPDGAVVIGISVEPADSVAARIAELGAGSGSGSGGSGGSSSAGGNGADAGALVPARQQPSTLVLAQRIIKNAFNFLASFSGTAGQVEVVPLKAFEDWWRKFESRVRSDPGFLERDE